MSCNTKEEIQNAFTQKEQTVDFEYEAKMIMYRFLSEIESAMDERNMTRRELASLIGTSASYITQLFRGNKIVNLTTLAKMQVALGEVFQVSLGARTAGQDIDEDQLVRFLNAKAGADGCWIYHRHKHTPIIPEGDNYDVILTKAAL